MGRAADSGAGVFVGAQDLLLWPHLAMSIEGNPPPPTQKIVYTAIPSGSPKVIIDRGAQHF